MIACSLCGRENPDDARFCNGCGAALVEAPAAREERKVVSAVFVDLVGSTARAERLDPEDVRALLRRYHETLRLELERYGGTVGAGGLYSEPSFVFVLAEIEAARSGETNQTVASARHMVELAHARVDDQVVVPVVAAAAWMLARAGDADAGLLVDEFVERRQRNPGGLIPGMWTVHAALALDRLGRRGELAALGERPGSRFLEAALAIDSGRYVDAAKTLAAVGAPQLEAEVQVLAACERRAGGDEHGAEERLARARELLQRLGATARLRELDAAAA